MKHKFWGVNRPTGAFVPIRCSHRLEFEGANVRSSVKAMSHCISRPGALISLDLTLALSSK